jgi:hypothetical protein
VNASHVKNVPGRKRDVSDCQRIKVPAFGWTVAEPVVRSCNRAFGSKLGPFAPEYHAIRWNNTQNKPKRDNKLVHRLLVRDRGRRFESSLPDQTY